MTEIAHRAVPGRAPAAPALEDWWRGIDRVALAALLMISAAGMVLGLAASPPLAEKNGLWTYHYVARQAVFLGVAIGLMLAVSTLSPRWIRRGGVVMFLVFLAATAALPWFGTNFGKGAMRWYSLGVGSIQPSEFLKPAFVIVSAWLMAGAQEPSGPPGRLVTGLMAAAIAGMLAMQPDFGQAALLLAVWAAMLFVSGVPVAVVVGFGALACAGGVAAYLSSDHFAGRIDAYLVDGVEPNTQLAYAEAAIREGGLFGVGAAQGMVKWTLPDAHTDFIIAVAAEEFGLLATLGLIGLFLAVTMSSLMRLVETRDTFVRLAGTGLAVLFGLQAFVNFAVAVRLLPAKGMTLPFVSYGGSSALAAGLAMGALLAFTRSRRKRGGA